MNGPTLREAPQIVGQRSGRGVTALRLFEQTLETDRFKIAWHTGVKARRWHRLLGDKLTLRLRRRFRSKRRPAREHLVKKRAQRVDVDRGAKGVGLTERLLRRHVAGSAHVGRGQCQRLIDVQTLRQPEIANLQRAIGREKNV